MALHDLDLSLFVGNAVAVSDTGSTLPDRAIKVVAVIAPKYQYQRDDGVVNWAVPAHYTTDSTNLTIPNLADTDKDGADVVWGLDVRFLDRKDQPVGGSQSYAFTFPEGAPTSVDFPSDVTLVDVVMPPEYGPTWAEQAEAAKDAAVVAQAASEAAAASIQRNQPGGVAGLTTSGTLYEAQMPDRLTPSGLSATNRTLVAGDLVDDTTAIGGAAAMSFTRNGNESARWYAAVVGDSTDAGGLRDVMDTVVAAPHAAWVQSGGGIQKGGAQSWWTWMCLLSGGRIVAHYNGAVAQDTPAGQLEILDKVLASGANLIFIGGAAHNGFTSATPEATIRAQIISMVEQCRRVGATVVLRTIYPDLNTTALANQIRRHNAWVKKYAAANNILVADTYGAVVDPASTTGAWKAGYSSDGTHATVAAAKIAGQRALEDVAGLLRGASTHPVWLPTDNVAATQLLSNPLFLTDANLDNNPEPWSATAAGTLRSVTDGVINSGLPQISSATAAFTSEDIGRIVTGTGIPANASIKSVESATQATMHVNATATATGVTLGFGVLGKQLVTDSAVLGKAWRLRLDGGTLNATQQLAVDGTLIAAGDRLKWCGMLKFEGASAGTLIPQPQISQPGITGYISSPITYATGVDSGWFYFECDTIVQPTATLVRCGVTTNAGTGIVWMGQMGLYNLSKIG